MGRQVSILRAGLFGAEAAHKHYSLADIEWMILPPVLTGQAYVAELQHTEIGARAPVAVVLWASVSDEIDARLSAQAGKRIRLRPDEWKSGEHLWIVDVAGEPSAIAGSLKQLSETVFKEKQVKIALPDGKAGTAVANLHDLLAAAETRAG